MPANKNTTFALKLIAVAIAMFGFAVFILPPMYDVLCDLTGLNGKVNQSVEQLQQGDTGNTRPIHIQFVANNNSSAPWPFRPNQTSMKAVPGKIYQTSFRVENPHNKAVTARAIPSVSPAHATQYLKKTQCFCFEEQPLKPFEGKDMGLIFYIDPEIPDTVTTMTLSYQLYDITDQVTALTPMAGQITAIR